MKRRSFLTGITAAALPIAAGAQVPGALPQPFAQQLTIGVNAPLSGPQAGFGRQIADGVQAAIDYANLNYGPIAPGTNAFSMRPFDNAGALAQTIMNVRFAASDPTVIAVIGAAPGAMLTTALAQYAEVRMPLLAPASTTDSLTARGYRNVWRLPTKDSTEGSLFARNLARQRRPRSAVAVTQDGEYGPDVARGFTDQASALGIHAMTYTFPQERPDYGAAAATLLSKRPEYLYLCGSTQSLGPIASALRAAGYAGQFGASEGFYNRATLEQFGDALRGALVSTSFPPLERAPSIRGLLADFRARTTVSALSAFAYAAAQIIMAASRHTGAPNRLAVLRALQLPGAFDTIAGSFQFTPSGDPIDPNLYFYSVAVDTFAYAGAAHATPFVL